MDRTTTETKPDGRRLRGDRTRKAVLEHAVDIALADGLEGLTFGRVAMAAGVPKSTLQALFHDREQLQSQTLERGAETFAEEVRRRLAPEGTGFERLAALCEAWFDVADSNKHPGGCLVTAAAAEYRARPGLLQTLVHECRERWRTALLEAARSAKREGTLRPEVDVDMLVFEILAVQGAANLSAGGAFASNETTMARRIVAECLSRARA